MRGRMVRWAFGLAVFVLAALPAVAAPQSEGAGSATPPEITLMFRESAGITYNENMYSFAAMRRKLNVVVKPMALPRDGFNEKVDTMLVSGDLPDILLPGMDTTRIHRWGQTLFVPVDQHLNKMPTLRRLIAEYPEVQRILGNPDGHLYALPAFRGDRNQPVFHQGPSIRADFLQPLGIEPARIETLEDLYNTLKRMSESKGNNPVWGVRFGLANNMPNIALWFGTGHNMYFDDAAKVWRFGALDANYRLAVEFLARVYQAGIVEKALFTTGDTFLAKDLKEYFGFFTDGFHIADQWSASTGGRFEAILPPKVGGTRYAAAYAYSVVQARGWAISKKTRHLDAALSVADWLYSDEGAEVVTFGEEGGSYRKTADGQHEWLARIWSFNPSAPSVFDWGVFGALSMYFREPVEYTVSRWSAPSKPRFIKLYIDAGVVLPSQPPVPPFNADEERELRTLLTDIQTFTEEGVVKFIKNQTPMQQWEAFVKTLRGMGVERVVAIHNQAYQRWLQR